MQYKSKTLSGSTPGFPPQLLIFDSGYESGTSSCSFSDDKNLSIEEFDLVEKMISDLER